MWHHLTNEEIYVIVARNFGHGERNVKRYRLKDLLTPAQRRRVREGSKMASTQAVVGQRHESRKDRRSRERDERRRKPHSKEWFVRFMARNATYRSFFQDKPDHDGVEKLSKEERKAFDKEFA